MEDISRFIVENAWSFVALLPATIVLVLSRAAKGTTIVVKEKKVVAPALDRRWRLPLMCSLLSSNSDESWRLRR